MINRYGHFLVINKLQVVMNIINWILHSINGIISTYKLYFVP